MDYSHKRRMELYAAPLIGSLTNGDSPQIVANPAICPECHTAHPFREVLTECCFCKYNADVNRRMQKYEN